MKITKEIEEFINLTIAKEARKVSRHEEKSMLY